MSDDKKQKPAPMPDVSSFLDLKSEFLERKRAAVAKTYDEKYVNRTKHNLLLVTKHEKKEKAEKSNARADQIQRNAEAIRKEQEERERRRLIMEKKTAIYERMATTGDTLSNCNGKDVEFLVNFTLKKREIEERSAANREAAESSSSMSAVHYRDVRDLPDEDDNPLIVHYNPAEDKGRVFGASHVALPVNNETERQKRIAELKQMTVETQKLRQKRKRVVDAKKAADRLRLNRLRARKGLPPLAEDSGDESEVEVAANLDDIPLPEEPATTSAPPPPQPPPPARRAWDKAKFGYRTWIEAQREERDDEFRPPSSYYSSSKH